MPRSGMKHPDIEPDGLRLSLGFALPGIVTLYKLLNFCISLGRILVPISQDCCECVPL